MNILANPWFYGALIAIALFGFGFWAKTVGKVPLVGKLLANKNVLLLIGGVGLASTMGLLGAFSGTGSLGGNNGDWYISDLQVTTGFEANNTAVSESTGAIDTIDVRLVDAYVDETTSAYELDVGIITVTRSGKLNADSCSVVAIVPVPYQDQSAPDGNVYPLVEMTALNEPEVYLNSGGASTTSSAKGQTTIAFAEGVSTGTLGVLIEIDEGGHDALDQYNYKPVIVDICGKPFTFNFHRMD